MGREKRERRLFPSSPAERGLVSRVESNAQLFMPLQAYNVDIKPYRHDTQIKVFYGLLRHETCPV